MVDDGRLEDFYPRGTVKKADKKYDTDIIEYVASGTCSERLDRLREAFANIPSGSHSLESDFKDCTGRGVIKTENRKFKGVQKT